MALQKVHTKEGRVKVQTRYIDARKLSDAQLNKKIEALESKGFVVVERIYYQDILTARALAEFPIRFVELERKTGGAA